MAKPLPIYQIDSFIIKEKLFSGNPASIVHLDYDDDINDQIKQKIAAEVNQSMTAFVSKRWFKIKDECDINNNIDDNNSSYKIRYFTPIQEFQLCCHAAVAASLLLSKTLPINYPKTLEYETKFGEHLHVTIDNNELITISMPTYIPNMISKTEEWLRNIVEFGLNIDNDCVEEVSLTEQFLLIRLKDSSDNNIAKIVPNYHVMKNMERKCIYNGIVVTQKANFDKEKCHFFSRVFGPWIGVNEDPVCGSAHALLTPFWKHRLGVGVNGVLIANQCSERGGILRCFANKHRIELTGNARTVFEAKLYL